MHEMVLSNPNGIRIMPDAATGVGVLVLAGSSGRIDTGRAEVFARHGAVSEAIQWFGGPGQNTGPWDIPLELFFERVAALKQEADRIVVVGTSFGSEAALLTGAHHLAVQTVVAFAPSDVAWGARNELGQRRPHWTLGGKPVPYVPFIDDWQPDTNPPSYRGLYERSRGAAPEAVQLATIPTERIDHVMLIAGGDDQVWPSVHHSKLIAERRHQHGLDTVIAIDDDAGHRTVLPAETSVTGGVQMIRGGTPEADRRLGEAAWTHISQFISGAR